MKKNFLVLPLGIALASCSSFSGPPSPARLDGTARKPINNSAAVEEYRKLVLDKNAQLTKTAAPVPASAVERQRQGVNPEVENARSEFANASPKLKTVSKELQTLKGQPPQASDAASMKRIESDIAEIQGMVNRGASSLFMVHFDYGSTKLKVPDAIANVIIPAAKSASKISLRGHTDAAVITPVETQIALARAVSARNYLIKNGVPGDKIRVSYQSAKYFIADNLTAEGRALNRRVEIDLGDAKVAEFPTKTTLSLIASLSIQ